MARARLQKIIAQAGLASRREAEAWMVAGRVAVNGQPVFELGAAADPALDAITVDGQPLPEFAEKICILLYKPRGVMTTRHDPEGRRTVLELLPPGLPRLNPVGRLDWDSEGLLLLTNDGELAHALTHPANKIPKTYAVKVSGVPPSAAIRQLREGVMLIDGPSGPLDVRHLKRTTRHTWLTMTITSGKTRVVRRACAAVGLEVLKLQRMMFAGLPLGDLPEGRFRLLTPKEIKRLWAVAVSRGGALKDLPEGEPAGQIRQPYRSTSARTKRGRELQQERLKKRRPIIALGNRPAERRTKRQTRRRRPRS